jgi:hypothetical protein
MRAVVSFILLGAACWADVAFGIWKMNVTRSTFARDTQPKSITVRIEPHAKGEVSTLDRIEADGRTTTSSSICTWTARSGIIESPGVQEPSRRVEWTVRP